MSMSESEELNKIPAELILEELRRLRDQPAILGRPSVKMMEEFREFSWTQGTMITVGALENVLSDYLEKELAIGGDVIKGWKTGQQFYWRAMLSLAVYEANTMEKNRATIEKYLLEYDAAIRELVDVVGSDTMGETIVESTRRLGEAGGKLKKRKIPKTPGKLSRDKGTKGGKKGTVIRTRGRPKRIQGRTKKTEKVVTKNKQSLVKGSRRKRKLKSKRSSTREMSRLSPSRDRNTSNTSSPDKYRAKSATRERRGRRRRDQSRKRSRRQRSRSRSSYRRKSRTN